MKIRLAKLDEATEIANLYLDSFKATLPSVKLAHSDEEVRAWYHDCLLPETRTFVALDGNIIVGFMSLRGEMIEEIYIEPSATGHGLGTKFMKLAKELNPNLLRAYTFQINKGARHFYEQHGFKAIGFNDGDRNEEHEPDVLYEWKAT
jgi:GNAT superfamily N-acetyltransferase